MQGDLLSRVLDQLDPNSIAPMLLLGLVVLLGAVVAVVAIVTSHWRAAREARVAGQIKLELIRRGDPIAEIERIAGPLLDRGEGAEVVVEQGGDWYAARLLKERSGLYYIHYEGYDDDQDEWVEESRVRFPAASPAPRDRAEPWPGNRVPSGVDVPPSKGPSVNGDLD